MNQSAHEVNRQSDGLTGICIDSFDPSDLSAARVVDRRIQGVEIPPAEVGKLPGEWFDGYMAAHGPKGDETARRASVDTWLKSLNGHAGTYRAALEHVQANPLPDRVEAIPGPVVALDLADENLTDLGNARRLVRLHGHRLRFCHTLRQWFVYDGKRWAEDQNGEIARLAKRTVKSIARDASDIGDDDKRRAALRWSLKSESAERIGAMIRLAESESEVSIVSDQLDSDPWLLNCSNGTLDLQTGRLRPHSSGDLLTKIVNADYQADADCPEWLAFLDKIMAGDQQLTGYVQRALGYSLTGSTVEQCLFFAHGDGSNGKSTLLDTVGRIMDKGYATVIPTDLIVAKSHEVHPTGLTDLDGKRFIQTEEIEDGKRLAESLLKTATGGTPIRARRMRQDSYQFEIVGKIWLAANHKPEIRGTDHAIWRRIKLIPFNVKITDAEKDTGLKDRLIQNEAAGILAWIAKGTAAYLANGLGEPEAVTKATEAYRSEMDQIGDFLGSECVVTPGVKCEINALYRAYDEWSRASGTRVPLTKRRFGDELSRRGYPPKESSGKSWREGVGLRAKPSKKDGDPGEDAETSDSTQF